MVRLVIVLVLAIGLGAGMVSAQEVVCSSMQGQLVDSGGRPVADVTVERRWDWRGKSGRDTSVTDAKGRFAFDAVPAKRGLFGWLSAQEAVNQSFSAEMPEGTFEFLFISTRSLAPNSETGGPDFDVICRIGVEPGFDGFHWGTCSLRS